MKCLHISVTVLSALCMLAAVLCTPMASPPSLASHGAAFAVNGFSGLCLDPCLGSWGWAMPLSGWGWSWPGF